MGRLIVVEGIDGAGKRTLTDRLTAELTARGRSVARVGVPRYGVDEHADLVRAGLYGRLPAVARSVEAMALLYALDRRAAAVARRIGGIEERPSVAILSNQAGRPFLNAADVLTSDLVRRAGGDLVAERIGLRATGPVTAERLIAAEPDAILLIDVTGEGRDSYRPLLDNPAVAELPAVREGRVKLLPARISYGTGGVRLADGLEEIARWLHPEVFR